MSFDAQKIIEEYEGEAKDDYDEGTAFEYIYAIKFAVAECQKQQDEMVERLKKEIDTLGYANFQIKRIKDMIVEVFGEGK